MSLNKNKETQDITKILKYSWSNGSAQIKGNQIIITDFESGDNKRIELDGKDLIQFRIDCLKRQINHQLGQNRPYHGIMNDKERVVEASLSNNLDRVLTI